MPRYHKLGKIPHKRHTTFKKENGKLHYEELFGTIGFDGMSSLLYHLHRPTQVKEIKKAYSVAPEIAVEKNLKSYLLKGFEAPKVEDHLESRISILINNDLNILLSAPTNLEEDYFYKNTDGDEVIFVHKGTGTLRTFVGNLKFKEGDYLVIPRGMIYTMKFNSSENRLFIVESYTPVYTPKRYRNHFGQLLEHSPYCERDLRVPEELETHDESGAFIIKIKKEQMIHEYTYASHPFDVAGWDGYNFPYAFSIHVTGLQCLLVVHTPLLGAIAFPVSLLNKGGKGNAGKPPIVDAIVAFLFATVCHVIQPAHAFFLQMLNSSERSMRFPVVLRLEQCHIHVAIVRLRQL